MIGFMTPFQRDQLKKKIELNIDLKKFLMRLTKYMRYQVQESDTLTPT